MHPRTIATLQMLDQAEWFSHVGINDTKVAIVLSSWDDAIEHCSSTDWEAVCLEAANQYRERLAERSRERFNRWNSVVGDIKPTVVELVERKVAPVMREHHLPDVFRHTVEWDIVHLCMEAEYADVFPPGFYADQGHWYERGHFPCGWKGVFPRGTLVVY